MTQPLPPAALLADLYKVRPAIYWADFLASAGIGWAAFAVAALSPWGSVSGLVAIIIAVVALNRAVTFTHEISHHRRGLPGFEAAWNALVGFPLLLPTFIYGQVHLDHHRTAMYGTKADPSYLPFARSSWTVTAYLLHTLIAPALLALRFMLLAPMGFVSGRVEIWLIERASAIAFNPAYQRKATPGLVRLARRDSALLLAMWAVLIAFGLVAIDADVLIRAAALWYVVMVAIGMLEAIRTLTEHAYESPGVPMDKSAQVADSNDIPGRFWTELWAPLGLHYHATHHAFPGVPYYALPRAYRRLLASTPDHGRMTRPGLLWALRRLYGKDNSGDSAPR